jgi:hypothetical protein
MACSFDWRLTNIRSVFLDARTIAEPTFDLLTVDVIVLGHHVGNVAERDGSNAFLNAGPKPIAGLRLSECGEILCAGRSECFERLGERPH